MKIQLFFLLALLSPLAACKNEPDPNLEKILGKWQASVWLLAGKDSGRDASAVNFEFRNDGSYAASMGAQAEKGVFKIEGDKLYTTADGPTKIQKMVKLSRIAADTLIMDMNRQGDAEQLVLLRKK